MNYILLFLLLCLIKLIYEHEISHISFSMSINIWSGGIDFPSRHNHRYYMNTIQETIQESKDIYCPKRKALY